MYSNRTHAHAPGAASAAPRLLLGVLRRQRWLVAACLALGVAAGLLLARRVTPTYRASATVLVGDGSADMLRQDGAAQPMENRIATEMELLRSGRLAEAVVDSLQLRLAVTRPANAVRSALFSRVHVPLGAEPGEYRFVRVDGGRFRVERAETGQALGTFAPGQPVPLPGAEVVLAPTAGKHASFGVEVVGRESAAGALASAIDVEQGGQANLLRVSYAGPDPVLVRDVPNAIAREFIHLRKELQSAEARSTAAFLRGRLDTIRAQLTASEDQLQGFREREGVIDLGVEASTQVSRQAQLEAERGQLQAEQQALGTLLAEARATERTPGDVSPYRKLVAFPTLLRQEAVSQMLTSLARVEDQRSELLTRRRPNDPEVLPLTNRVNELETQLASIVITYQRGLASQVAQIDGTLGQFRSSMDRIPGKEAQHGRLERNARSLAEVYGLLQTRLKEAEIAEAVQDPGVRVMDTARLPTRPQGSTRGLMLLGGGLFGLLLGIGLAFAREYRDGTVRSRDDVEGVAHLPVLGWIPRIQGLGEPNPRIAAPLRALGRVVGTGRNASAPVL
ncbi:MAG TPA: Wzz/FepE/Etk N-terminal domain-containing protein, partial [Longimicrobium sp.]|nr:Wzz/FepE/Etk N-terminal domain-containing protein [Longimicrobium sp.]